MNHTVTEEERSKVIVGKKLSSLIEEIRGDKLIVKATVEMTTSELTM